MKIIKKIRAIFTILQMIISISLVIILMMLFKNKNHSIRKKWAQIQMKLLGITIEIEGKIDPSAQMIVMNHQSVLDIITMEYLYPKNIAWVSKKEIGDIPWFGKILTLPNMIAVERESKKSLIKLLKDAKERLNDDRPLAIFPEGTRTNGKKMLKFKSGARIIAEKHNLKVQPIIIINTINILDSKNISQQSGTVKVIYLDSVQAQSKTDWFEEVENNMKQKFQKEIKKW